MMKNAISILDYTNFFINNVKLPKSSHQNLITIKNKNCIKYFKKANVKQTEGTVEIIKIDKFIERDEIKNFIKDNLLKYDLIIILKECKNNNDLNNLKIINEKLKKQNLNFLNIIYTKNKEYKDIDIKGKIIIPLEKEKQILFKETYNIYNSILNLMSSNKKVLFSLCKEENIPIINLNINNTDNIGNAVLYILKSFKDIQYLDVLILTLISKKKVSVEDIYFIKDPLEEYMDYNKQIIVQELIEENYKENLTINLIGLK